MADSEGLLLGPRARKLVGFAVGLAAFAAIIASIILCVWMLGRLISIFSIVLWPLAIAGILALLLGPVVDLVGRTLRVSRAFSVVLLYLLVLVAIAGILLAIVPVIITQILDLIDYLPVLWRQISDYLALSFPRLIETWEVQMERPEMQELRDTVAQQMRNLIEASLPFLREAGARLFSLFATVAAAAVIPVYLFFFLLSRDDPTRRLPQHLPFLSESQRNDVLFLVREFIGIIVSFFRGQLLIGLLMGLLFATGFSLIGLRSGALLGLLLGLLNIIPYLGSIIGLAICLPLAYFQPGGGWMLLALVMGVFTAVQMVESWVLTPKIMGHQTGLHPVTIIVAVFFWGIAFGGILGMLLAVPLTAFFVTAWRWANQKYFVPLDSAVSGGG